MRVAMYYNNDRVLVEEMPVPPIGPGELLMRVHACGICGSDVLEWYRKDSVPLVLGHEVGGEVAAVGEGVIAYKIGDRISASHHVPCNTCHYCRSGHHTMCDTLRTTHFDPGGFAEYVRLPAINVDRGVYPLPPEVSYDEATFIEPLACVVRGQRRAGLSPGQSVLVLGSGVAGLLHIQLARALGAGRVVATDVLDYRLEAALKFGADFAFSSDDVSGRLRQVNGGRLADLVIACTGVPQALKQALKVVERGGTILFFAPAPPDYSFPLPFNDTFWRTDVTLTTSYAGSPADHHLALELIRSRRVSLEGMVSHRLPFGEVGMGFQLVSRARDCLKVIVHPQR
ncbi:MAG: alcohol dehydrogenase catalytic domain-containing protein [Chloroflexi bacterium]|nr:alcohol dehydrogenase catalytic domain-containing protein [Chloroflexota bacterium]